MKNKNNVYVQVESKEQAETYRKVLEAMGEPISFDYYPYDQRTKKLTFSDGWYLSREEWKSRSCLTFGELIDLLHRKPLIISEDGVPLYEGDSYYRAEVYHGKWVLSHYTKDFIIDELKLDHCVVHNPEIAKAFSTKKSALEWIEAQKPKSVELKLFNGGTANLYKNEIVLHGGIKLSPSDLEDLIHAYNLAFREELKNG